MKTSALRAAKTLARLLAERKACDVLIYDVRRLTSELDYLVIATTAHPRHGQALAHQLEYDPPAGLSVQGSEGRKEAAWVLLDFGDVVAHLFTGEARSYYDLEMLWGVDPPISWK